MADDKAGNPAGKKIDDTINKGLQSAKDTLAEKMLHLANKEVAKTPQETVYSVVFTGTFTKDEKLVIAAMAKFFKQGQEATKRLLKPGRVVKTFPDKGPADKLAKMLSGIGLSCKVEMEVTGGEPESEAASLLQKAALKLADSKTPEVRVSHLSKLGWKLWAGLAVFAAALAGLGVWWWMQPPVVEGDSFASYKESVQEVIDHAPPEKRAAIQTAVDTLTGAGFAFHDENTFGGTEKVAAGVVYSRVEGLNAEEILQVAAADIQERRNGFLREIDSIKQEIAAEQAIIAELEKSNTKLKQLSVSEAKFSWVREEPELTLKLTNGSDETISKILFQGYLHDASGKLLVSHPFSFGKANGILPGGYGWVVLIPSLKEPWAVQSERKNWQSIRFSASVENAINIKGEEIGIDTRPNRKKIDEHNERIKRFEKELAKMKL